MGVEVLMAGVMLLVGFMALMTLNALTWTLWDPSSDPPLGLNVLFMMVIVVLSAAPGVVVGLAAGPGPSPGGHGRRRARGRAANAVALERAGVNRTWLLSG